MIAPTLSNPFLNLHFNQLDGTQNVRNNTFEQNELPSDTEERRSWMFVCLKYSVDVRTIEVQVPFAQGVIAPISDVNEGEGSSSKATNTHKVA